MYLILGAMVLLEVAEYLVSRPMRDWAFQTFFPPEVKGLPQLTRDLGIDLPARGRPNPVARDSPSCFATGQFW